MNGTPARDVADATVTMTFDEIAKAKGLKRRSAVRWVQRHDLRRTIGNDGRTRVTVPVSLLTPQGDDARGVADDVVLASVHESHPVVTAAVAPAAARDIAGLVAGLGAAIAGLRDALKAAEARADQAQARADRADARAAALAQERDQARLGRDRARGDMQAHQGRADRLQVEIDAARAGPWLSRVWRAARGRRAGDGRTDPVRRANCIRGARCRAPSFGHFVEPAYASGSGIGIVAGSGRFEPVTWRAPMARRGVARGKGRRERKPGGGAR